MAEQQTVEETTVPLNDDARESLHPTTEDDETVSSAPPRLEVDTAAPSDEPHETVMTHQDANHSELQIGSSPHPLKTTSETPSSSARKFVTFLSDAEGTPITAQKRFVDDDGHDGDIVDRIGQPMIIDEGNEDEKKEDAAATNNSSYNKEHDAALVKRDGVAIPTSEELTAILSTPVPALPSSPIQSTPTSSAAIAYSPNQKAINSPSRSTGRRSITLRLIEEIDSSSELNKLITPFKRLNLRRFRSLSLSTVMVNESKIDMTDRSNNGGGKNNNSSNDINNSSNSNNGEHLIDRGIISVSWYEGTTSAEMTEHVFNCVLRKLRSGSSSSSSKEKRRLEDVRLLDESVVPSEEVVLCPFLPDGSHFLLKFKTALISPKPTAATATIPPYYISQAPDSPSAEPSPYPSSANLNGLNHGSNNNHAMNAQLQLLNAATALLQSNGIKTQGGFSLPATANTTQQRSILQQSLSPRQQLGLLHDKLPKLETVPREFRELQSKKEDVSLENANINPTDALIEQQLRQLNELFLLRNQQHAMDSTNTIIDNDNTNSQSQPRPEHNEHDPHLLSYYKSQEKKQVIFTIANYLVLFMSLIAISAEIQSRLPQWMAWVSDNYDSVQNCATDHDALFECISNGNFSGLVASFVLWATQSASAKRIFLFGFESPKKLWTVVYEALVSAVCWGLSYIFIRRGLNPNTREKFIQKYWKDAVYGSLAGFNAAFMKAVLKNLVPQDVALQAIETRQLKIFHWLGMLMSEE